MKLRLILALPLLALTLLMDAGEERLNVKTNLLYDLTSTLNIGMERRVAPRFSVDLSGNYNPWTLGGGMKIRHWVLQPELRWWPKFPMRGHFIAVHALGGEFNLDKAELLYNQYPAMRTHRFAGWGAGIGIGCGYRYDFSQHIAMEAEVGVGAIYAQWDRYSCGKCGERLSNGSGVYVGPTKLALNLIYSISPKKRHLPEPDSIPVRIIEKIVTDTVYIYRHRLMDPAELVTDIHDSVVAEQTPMQFDLRLQYHLDSDKIDPTLGDNAKVIALLRDFLSGAESGSPIDRVRLIGYSSIEGNAVHNLDLSARRAISVAKLIESLYPNLTSYIEVEGRGEDWHSLDEMLPSLSESDPDRREEELRKIKRGEFFRNILHDMLPSTRRTEIKIYFK